MCKKQVLFGLKSNLNRQISHALEESEFEPSFAHLDVVDFSWFSAVIPLQLQHYDEIRRVGGHRSNYLMPSEEHVELCDDKAKFNRFLITEGFGEHVPTLRDRGEPYPYIWKPHRGEWGKGCIIVRSPADEALIDVHSVGFAQQCVEGANEVAVHVLCKNGHVYYMSTVIYSMETTLMVRSSCNPAQMAKFYNQAPSFQELLKKVLARLNYSGICCFNLKFAGNKAMILELNPRFGSSLAKHLLPLLRVYVQLVT